MWDWIINEIKNICFPSFYSVESEGHRLTLFFLRQPSGSNYFLAGAAAAFVGAAGFAAFVVLGFFGLAASDFARCFLRIARDF